MSEHPHPIVFTDLDATLLDHETYSHDEAQPMIDVLSRNDIPIVFVTSKTEPEARKLQQKLDICAPFIIENGGAIFIPKCCSRMYSPGLDAEYEVIQLGKSYDACLNVINRYRDDFGLRGFSHMHFNEVSKRTGLQTESAKMAKERYCSEPFVMEDESLLPALREHVEREGFVITRGGRFFHLIGKAQNKGAAVHRLLAHAESAMGVPFRSIALGDSENDFSMLSSVDIPILIPRHDGNYADIDLPHMIKAPHPGPRGWNAALKTLFETLEH